jgi:hypothetical protein
LWDKSRSNANAVSYCILRVAYLLAKTLVMPAAIHAQAQTVLTFSWLASYAMIELMAVGVDTGNLYLFLHHTLFLLLM